MTDQTLPVHILYDELARVLSSQGSLTGPSECHGIITAVASTGTGLNDDAEHWIKHIMASDEDGEAPQAEAFAKVLKGLKSFLMNELGKDDAGFQLGIPDDEEPLGTRAACLVEWSEGYLFGLGLATHIDSRSLSEEAQEFIADLREITKLHVEIDEPGEEDEVNFTELYEYVRMGVQVVFDDVHGFQDGQDEGVRH